MSNLKVSLEELELMEEDYEENHERQQNILKDLESSLEAIDSLLVIEDYRQHLLEKKEISREDIDAFRIVAGSHLSLDKKEIGRFYPSLENYDDPRIALEGSGSKIIDNLKYMGRHAADLFSQMVEATKYDLSLFNLLSRNFAAAKNKINEIGDVTISIKPNRFFYYGVRREAVKDSKEYLVLSKKSADFLVDVGDIMSDYMSTQLYSGWKTLYSYALKKSDEQLDTNYKNLAAFIQNVLKNKEVKFVRQNRVTQAQEYQTDVMLGMYRLLCWSPSKEYLSGDVSLDDKKEQVQNIHTWFQNYIPEDPIDKPKRIQLTVSKRWMQDFFKPMELLLRSYEEYIGDFNRVITMQSNFHLAEYFVTAIALALAEVPGAGLIVAARLLLVNYRVLMASSGMISNANYKLFTYMRGHLKNTIMITDKALDAS